jgi:ABC-2 type transport system ATP-binding protein
VTHVADGVVDVEGAPAAEIGDLAAARGIALHELTPTSGTLEDAYLSLTGDDVEYKTKDI